MHHTSRQWQHLTAPGACLLASHAPQMQSNGSTQLGTAENHLQVTHTCYSSRMQAGSVPSCSSAPLDCSLSSVISLLSLADLSSAACSSC